jgi:hypothetical protein
MVTKSVIWTSTMSPRVSPESLGVGHAHPVAGDAGGGRAPAAARSELIRSE